MPWINVRGSWVHLKMAKRRTHVCGCELGPGAGLCGALSLFQCDYPVGTGKRTCSAHLCASHALEVGPERHYCPRHAKSAPPPQAELFAETKTGPEGPADGSSSAG